LPVSHAWNLQEDLGADKEKVMAATKPS